MTAWGGVLGNVSKSQSSNVSNSGEVKCLGNVIDYNEMLEMDIKYSNSNKINILKANNRMGAIGGIVGCLTDSEIYSVTNNGNVTVDHNALTDMDYEHTYESTHLITGVDTITIKSGALCGFGGIAGYSSSSIVAGSQMGSILVGIAGTEEDWWAKGLAVLGGYIGYMDGASFLNPLIIDNTVVTTNSCSGMTIWGTCFIGGFIGYSIGDQYDAGFLKIRYVWAVDKNGNVLSTTKTEITNNPTFVYQPVVNIMGAITSLKIGTKALYGNVSIENNGNYNYTNGNDGWGDWWRSVGRIGPINREIIHTEGAPTGSVITSNYVVTIAGNEYRNIENNN